MIYSKIPKALLSPALLIAVLGLSSCGNSPSTIQTSSRDTSATHVQQQLGEQFEARKGHSFGRKTEFESWATDQLNTVEARFAELEKRFATVNASASKKWKSEIKPELKVKMQTAKDKLATLKSASQQAWPHVSQGFKEALQSLQDGFAKASNKFKTSQKDSSKKARNM